MAPAIAQGAKSPKVATEVAAPVVTPKTLKLVDSVRAQFTDFAVNVGAMLTTKAKFAPIFMKACLAWQAETTGTFIQFTRLIDPSIPEAQKAYRAHSGYQAADYLRREFATQQRRAEAKRTGHTTGQRQAPTVTPLDAVARLLATILPLVTDTPKLWALMSNELRWTDRQLTKVQHMAEQMPGLPLKANKGAEFKVLATASRLPDNAAMTA